jgi:hypothetical protein
MLSLLENQYESSIKRCTACAVQQAAGVDAAVRPQDRRDFEVRRVTYSTIPVADGSGSGADRWVNG